jgi:hypothetical protein
MFEFFRGVFSGVQVEIFWSNPDAEAAYHAEAAYLGVGFLHLDGLLHANRPEHRDEELRQRFGG